MLQVDPAGLVSAAQRIVEALGDLVDVDPVHPPLGADPASKGAATRLSTAGTILAATLTEQALGLALTAEQLVRVGAGFTIMDESNASNIGAVVAAAGAVSSALTATGWAPASPPLIPDVRPPIAPPPPAPGEAFSNALHSGDPNAGEAFIGAWNRLSQAAEAAADNVRAVATNLPATWESPVATDVVRAHLGGYADALDASALRARAVAGQADQHVGQNVQARNDIPSPQEFSALRQQLQQVAQANAASGGKYAVPLAQLTAQLNEMDAKAAQGYGTYHAESDATTAGTPDSQDPARAGADPMEAGGQPGTDGQGGPMSPDKAGELASMLPQMIPQLLGALGGMVGGAFGSIGQVPQALMGAGSQAAQSLSGMMKPSAEPVSAEIGKQALDDGLGGAGTGGGGGGGATVPAGGGGAASLAPASTPSTGRTPTAPPVPAGGLPPPVAPQTPSMGGGMPMGMPIGGLAGHGGGGGQERPVRPKNLVVPPTPHTESVTGKATADRIALSSAVSGDPDDDSEPPDDEPPRSPRPIVRRISTGGPRDEDP
jgi:hypothetical protein